MYLLLSSSSLRLPLVFVFGFAAPALAIIKSFIIIVDSMSPSSCRIYVLELNTLYHADSSGKLVFLRMHADV
jgi:hypothetical protein